MSSPQENLPNSLIFWPDLMRGWLELNPRLRRNTLRRAGRRLHRLWRDGADLTDWALELTAFEPQPDALSWPAGHTALTFRARPVSHDSLRALLQDWHQGAAAPLLPVEAGLFLRAFLREEGLERDQWRQVAADLVSDRPRRQGAPS